MGRLDDLSVREWELVHTSYAHALGSLERNEEMGERRFQLLLAVASAAGVAVGLVADVSRPQATLWAGTGVSIALSVLGLLTVSRLAKRNNTTTRLIEQLTTLRRQAMTEDSLVRALMVYDPYVSPSPRRQGWAPTKGGLVDLAGCTTALFVGTAVLLGGIALSLPVIVVVFGALAAAIAAWLAQVPFIRRVYRESSRTGA
jgi:hypothetical protein